MPAIIIISQHRAGNKLRHGLSTEKGWLHKEPWIHDPTKACKILASWRGLGFFPELDATGKAGGFAPGLSFSTQFLFNWIGQRIFRSPGHCFFNFTRYINKMDLLSSHIISIYLSPAPEVR